MSCLQIILSIVFLFAAAGEIYGMEFKKKKIRFFTTPIIMPLLAVFYISTADEFRLIILIAIIAGFIGDVCDLWAEDEGSEIVGMVSMVAFLAAHVFYIIGLLQPAEIFAAVPAWHYIFALPYCVAYLILYRALSPYLGELKIPGAVYMVSVFLMSFASLIRVPHYQGLAAWLPFVGSLLFICADTITAFHRSKGEIRHGNVYIGLTYISAQALIIVGLALI
jgi:uncharacterized membrane protein YhhN